MWLHGYPITTRQRLKATLPHWSPLLILEMISIMSIIQYVGNRNYFFVLLFPLALTLPLMLFLNHAIAHACPYNGRNSASEQSRLSQLRFRVGMLYVKNKRTHLGYSACILWILKAWTAFNRTHAPQFCFSFCLCHFCFFYPI